MDDLQSDLKKDTARGTNYSKQGGVVKRLMSVWQPLLSQAIAAEQHDMFEDNGRGASGRRDRPNYGPYLMLLEAEDLAHITLQSEGTYGAIGGHKHLRLTVGSRCDSMSTMQQVQGTCSPCAIHPRGGRSVLSQSSGAFQLAGEGGGGSNTGRCSWLCGS
jgi:hypothetical protein